MKFHFLTRFIFHLSAGVAQNQLYWHHSSLNLSKRRGIFSFGLVPENLTRGSQRYKFKAGEYEFNPNHNKSHLLVTSLLTQAFKMIVIRQAVRMLFTVIINYHDGLNCLRELEETDCKPTDWLCYDFLGGKQCCCQTQFPALDFSPLVPISGTSSKAKKTYSLEMGY